MPSRRRVLAACAAGIAGSLAGCVDPDVAMFVERVGSDRAVGERATVDPADRPDGADADLVADAVAGSATVAAERPPFEPERPVAHDGPVYDVSWRRVGTESRTEFEIVVRATTEPDVEPTIQRSALPEPDRRAVPEIGAEPGENQREPIRAGTTTYYDDAERDASVLVPEPEHDAVRSGDWTVVVESVREVEVALDRYRYEATEVAPSVSAFGARVREAYLFELDGLGDDERAFFERVAEEGSYYGDESREQFEGLADRIVAEPAIAVDAREGEWLVAYEDDHYWLRIDFVRMPEYAERLEAAEGPVTVSGVPDDADAGATRSPSGAGG